MGAGSSVSGAAIAKVRPTAAIGFSAASSDARKVTSSAAASSPAKASAQATRPGRASAPRPRRGSAIASPGQQGLAACLVPALRTQPDRQEQIDIAKANLDLAADLGAGVELLFLVRRREQE